MLRISAIFCWLLFASIGCVTYSDPLESGDSDVIFLVHGAGGPGHEYRSLIAGLRDAGVESPVQVVEWGAPPPLFFLNFQSQSIHNRAERDLAERIGNWRRQRPESRIDLIGHSAGGGVVLGALGRLNPEVSVDTVVLLAPSVSPGYELAPALAHLRGPLHVFHSDRDRLFLSWRTSTFGTYDNVRTKAAGNVGFSLASLSIGEARQVEQHPYDSRWSQHDNDGGHFGTLSRDFANRIVAPVLQSEDRFTAETQRTQRMAFTE